MKPPRHTVMSKYRNDPIVVLFNVFINLNINIRRYFVNTDHFVLFVVSKVPANIEDLHKLISSVPLPSSSCKNSLDPISAPDLKILYPGWKME